MYFNRIGNPDKGDNMYFKGLATLIKETICTSSGLATPIMETRLQQDWQLG